MWKKALSVFRCNVKFSYSFTTEYKEIWKENLVIYQKSLKTFSRHLCNYCFMSIIRILSSDAKALMTIPDATPSPTSSMNNKRWSACSGGSNSIDGVSADTPETPENYEEVCVEADSYHQWGQLIGNWNDAQRKRPKYVRDMVRRGIPNALRGMVWQLLSGAQDFALKELYPQLIKVHYHSFLPNYSTICIAASTFLFC